MPDTPSTHSEQDSETIRVALRLLAASNPMDEFPQEANAALTRLVEQVERFELALKQIAGVGGYGGRLAPEDSEYLARAALDAYPASEPESA